MMASISSSSSFLLLSLLLLCRGKMEAVVAFNHLRSNPLIISSNSCSFRSSDIGIRRGIREVDLRKRTIKNREKDQNNVVVLFSNKGNNNISGNGEKHQKNSNSSSSNAKRKKQNVSSSERGRRDEERRRQERKDDVVIGKTSAKRGEVDYPLDTKATEEEWMRQATDVEQEVYRLTDRGMECLKMLQLQESNESFDKVFTLRPNAYLWQAGIAKFYLRQEKEAAEIFARNAKIFESKFGGPASEERIWRDACELKLLNSLSKKERKQLLSVLSSSSSSSSTSPKLQLTEPIPPPSTAIYDDLLLGGVETRKVIRIIRDLFSASIAKNHYEMILSRAKLRCIGGTGNNFRADQKMWKLTSWYYLGLHYDALGQTTESKACMKMAIKVSPGSSGLSDDIIHILPLLHMTNRDWFDDDEYEDDDAERLLSTLGTREKKDFEDDPIIMKEQEKQHKSKTTTRGISTTTGDTYYADPAFFQSIKKSISEMRLSELQDALQYRGLPSTGSKKDVQARLFVSFMNDANSI